MKRDFILNRIIKVMLLVLSMTVGKNAWAENEWNISSSTSDNVTTFTITRDNTSVADTVKYHLVNLSAYAGQHYNVTMINGQKIASAQQTAALSGEFTFTAGDETNRTITVKEQAASTNAYKYQTSTSRNYKLEVTDVEGFFLVDKTRSFNTGTSVPSSGVFAIKDVVIQTGEYQNKDAGYDNNEVKSVTSSSYFNNAAPKAYYQYVGAELRMTLSMDVKEQNDGYQYMSILNSTSLYDNRSGCSNGDPGNINNSWYMAGFEHKTGGKDTEYKSYSFPVTSVGNNAGDTNPWDYGTSYILSMQKFNTNRRASDGRLLLPMDFSFIAVRCNASGGGTDNDEWWAKNVTAHIQAVEGSAPTTLAVSVAPGYHAKGNPVYVSVAFNEIVTSSDARLSTSWGSLNLVSGTSGSNVLTFSGTIIRDASGTLKITGMRGTISDLAGNAFSGSLNQDLGTGLDASRVYTISYDLDGGTANNPTSYAWETSSITLKEPTKFGYYFEGWTGSNGNVPNRDVTIPQNSRDGDLVFTANWTDVWGMGNGADGTIENPYCITTTKGLEYLASYVSKGNSCSSVYFVLGADISYSYEKAWNKSSTQTNYSRIGDYNHTFGGNFNGQNHTISGVRIYKSGDSYVNDGHQGLFGYINNSGSVRNVNLTNARITGYDVTGGIAGYNHGTIENCTVRNTVINAAHDNAYEHGGIAGQNQGTIQRCVSSVTISMDAGGGYRYGGIAGVNNSPGVIRDCFAAGVTIPNVSSKGAITGSGDGALRYNYYYNCTVGNNTIGVGINSNEDVSTNNGAVSVYALTHPVGITVTRANGTIISGSNIVYADGVTYDNKEYYTKQSTVTLGSANAGLTLVNVTYNGNNASDNGNGTWSFTMPNAATTVSSGYALSESYGITGQIASLIAEKEVEFNRTFTAGKASTICLPFAMTSISGGKVYEFQDVTYDAQEGWVATMVDATPGPGNEVTSTNANTPYLFMPDSDDEVTFSGTASASVTEGTTNSGDWTFHGTYSYLDYGDDPFSGTVFGFAATSGKATDGVTDVEAGQFVKAASGAFISPFRAFLTYTGSDAALHAPSRDGAVASAPDRIKVRLLGTGGDVTAVGTIDLESGDITIEKWFDMNGRSVDGMPTQPGIYLNNKGSKVMIK